MLKNFHFQIFICISSKICKNKSFFKKNSVTLLGAKFVKCKWIFILLFYPSFILHKTSDTQKEKESKDI